MQRSLLLLPLAFLIACAKAPSSEPKTIGLQPFGDIPTEWLDSISASLQHEHGARVILLSSRELPSSAITRVRTERYRADSLLRFLRRIRPDSVDLILGITRRDISATKYGADGKVLEPVSRYQDWGLFGLGFRPGTASVISSFRLGEGHVRFLQRMRKVAVHEVGHNRSLEHCTDSLCVMHSAVEHLSSIDQEHVQMCARCRAALH